MIELSNGHRFEYMVPSGALGFSGRGWPWEWPLRWMGLINPSLFTVVLKTLTLFPLKGNLRLWKPWDCVRLLPGGTVNAVGLTNPGIDYWCRKIGPRINFSKTPLIVSILGTESELVKMAEMLNEFPFLGLELNASCPNTDSDILTNTKRAIDSCKEVGEVSKFPLLLKLSVTHDIESIIKEVEDVIEAFSINSVPWSMVFPGKTSPLEHHGGGGVSGKPSQPLNWALVKELKRLSSVPVIAPGIWEFKDILKVRSLGADAVSFGAVHLTHPWKPTMFVKRDIENQRRRNHGRARSSASS